MTTLRYRTKIEFGVAVAVFAVGGFFALLALDINPSADDAVGPRFVPLFVSVAMVALGALIAFNAWRGDASGAEPLGEAFDGETFGFRDTDVGRVFAVIGCGAIYIALFAALGYMAATILAMVLILLAFGNRDPKVLIGFPLISAVIYQYIFMGLMGLHDPAGALVDFSAMSGMISGD